MALMACSECKQQISDKATTCPACGAPVRKKTRGKGLAIFAVIAVAGIVAIASREPPAATHMTPPPAKPDPEKEARFQAAVLGARAIKASMQNPASFDLGKVIAIGKDTFCYEYRGTNSFNAVVVGHFAYSPSKKLASSSPDAWNRNCAGKMGDDLSSVRFAM
jgi:hypothetical protein